MTPAQRGAQTRERDALIFAYADKFPQWRGGHITRAVERAMRSALKTGINPPIMIEQIKQAASNCRNYDARLKREHARPFTPKLEKQYTARIKNRQIAEGDCQRPWQHYFDYRVAHVKDVEPLDAADLAYVGQWTSCAVAQKDKRTRNRSK